MQYAYNTAKQAWHPLYPSMDMPAPREKDSLRCRWTSLRGQLLLQWQRLTAREIDEAGPSRSRLALLIQKKYGIASELVENYLSNFERTLPTA